MSDLFDYSSVNEAFKTLKAITPDQRGQFTTIFVFWSLAHATYYIVAALVVWSLGRRLIQASFAAFREARRERA